MNRRAFLTSLGKLGVFTILPGAGRVWRAERKVVAPTDLWSYDELMQFVHTTYRIVERHDKQVLQAIFNEPLPPRPLLPFPQLPPI